MIALLVPCSACTQPPLTPRLMRGNTCMPSSASTQPPLTRPSLFKHEHFEHFWGKHLVFTWRVYTMSIQVSRWLSCSKDGGTKVSMQQTCQCLTGRCNKVSNAPVSSAPSVLFTCASLYHVHLLHCLRQWAVRYVEIYTPNHGNIDGKQKYSLV
jgi:hypothetical protein